MPEFDADEPQRGHSTNLVGIPTGLLASAPFNDFPVPLHIAGVREMNSSLFEMLDQADCPAEAALAFEQYMAAVFGIDPEQRERRRIGDNSAGVRQFRSSYYRLLRGWGYDSSSPEGAVLKGWVESRFGLFPTFHKERLARYPSPPWMTYVEEKMSSRFHNNTIYCQLDLLYEFSQWALARLFSVGRRHVAVYRGVNDYAEHQIVERIDKRIAVLRLNNLVSFSSDRNIAGCFGDIILEARVPVVKILFFNTLLPRHALKGEGEYLVIGGDYRVKATYY
jgi:NAD+--dinitrogen-reductase ADP-D-ribosyltransferase